MKPTNLAIATLTVFSAFIHFTTCSKGDRSYIFSKCLRQCGQENCVDDEKYISEQLYHLKALQWSCVDECKYECMWQTVQAFDDDGSGVPQFFGKWPFVRYAGIQEPASMIFSVMNALTHMAILYFRTKISSKLPMYHVWHGMAVVGVVTWLCAAVFHTRDFPLTEKLDYFSAFGLVMYNLFSLIARLNVPRDPRILIPPAVLLISLYVYHIRCLCDHFDYGYNMLVNVGVGAINALGWVIWAGYQYLVKGKRHVLTGAVVVVGLALLLTLELLDFPPLLWTLDAHALWHAGTVPLTLLWYKFIIEDSLDLSEEKGTSYKKMI